MLQPNPSISPNQNLTDIIPRTYGAYLKHLRGRARPKISQIALVKEMMRLSGKPFSRPQLSRIENDELYPSIEQVPLIFQALRELNALITASEREWYITLAQQRIGEKGTHHERDNSPTRWQKIVHALETYERDAPFPIPVSSPGVSPHRHPLQKAETTFADIRHVIGRTAWSEEMTHSLLKLLPAKLFVIQGSLGSGKSSALHYLGWKLLQFHTGVQILLVELQNRFDDETVLKYTPEEHLDQFIGAVLAQLGRLSGGEKKKNQEREERLEMLFSVLSQQHTIVLVDNAEVILDEQGAISSIWKGFLTRYLRYEHHVTIVLAVEEWPGWYGGETSYVEETFLPPITAVDGVILLQRMGLDMVPKDLLEQASNCVHHHPGALEWLAKLVKKRAYSVTWIQLPMRSSEQISFVSRKTSEDQNTITTKEERALRHLLRQPQIFHGGAAHSLLRPIFHRVISKRVSHDALRLLELLAAAPLPLLPEAIEAVAGSDDFYEHLAELQRSSLLVVNEVRYQLQSLAAAAGYQQLTAPRREEIDQQLEQIYRAWIRLGEFADEREQALVITEIAFLLLKHERLLEAAELLIRYGWLSFSLGYGVALARRAQELLRQCEWRTTLEKECGGLLLKVYLARYLGEDLAATERKHAYLHLYEVMSERKVRFQPGTIQHIIHHKLRYLLAQDGYTEALNVIEEECGLNTELQEREPAIYAELVDRRAYVLGRWGDFLAGQPGHEEEAFQRRREAAEVHCRCIDMLHRYEQHASPLERSHLRAKRARYLNDASFYLRKTGQLEKSQHAMKRCLEIKETGLVVSSSLATSYDDYGELLQQLGKFQQAEEYSDRAMQIIEKKIEEGSSSAFREKGMIMINRGKLLLQLGRLDEAKLLFRDGISLVQGTERRYKIPEAEAGLREIDEWHDANSHHQLDWRWYHRYQPFVSYSDIKWLNQAGPFTYEEQEEVNRLLEKYDGRVSDKRLSALIAQSRQREIMVSLQEKREPQFHYPLIPLNEVQTKIENLSLLRTEIEKEEPNVIVRTIYLRTIDEQLDTLRLIAASGRRDDVAFHLYNAHLHPPPTDAELQIVIHQVVLSAQKGLTCSDPCIQELSQKLLGQLRHLRLVPRNLKLSDFSKEPGVKHVPAGQNTPSKLFTPSQVEQFFYDVFHTYGFNDWTIVLDPASDHASVSLALKQITLPADRLVSSTKVRELLGHEIETHVFRSEAGAKSPLAILSSGLYDYLDSEEGLALYYEAEISRHTTEAKPRFWIGTLACGLAAGVNCPPLTFRELLLFIEDLMVLRSVVSGANKSIAELREDARAFAIRRCLRVFRGVSHHVAGICSTKDVNYQRGFNIVSQAISEDKTNFDRLMCGSMGLHHLADLTELGIVQPAITHLQLATDPKLDERIMQFVE